MPSHARASSHLVTLVRWPLGIILTSWRYMWRTTPMGRREEPGSPGSDAAPQLSPQVGRDGLQLVADGWGPAFHRRYRVRITGARCSSEQLVTALREDPNRAAPTEFAHFERGDDATGWLRPGDELLVRMPGPWNGPVRVVHASPTSFRLATLDGHLEAGQIEFRAAPEDGRLVFEIESWARSGDRLSQLLYQRLRMAKEVQLHMWTSLLERVVELSGGRREGRIDIDTRWVDVEGVDALAGRPLNFDPAEIENDPPPAGWKVDQYRCALPAGSFDHARELMREYAFADPHQVRALYDADAPLEGRNMLLEIRFRGLRFAFGVRVGEVLDEMREVDGRRVHVWGWGYRTLEGHLEEGQMDYELWDWEDSGEVEFAIHVVSRAAREGNPILRLGFRLFGRGEQVAFARRACERMARLTAQRAGAENT